MPLVGRQAQHHPTYLDMSNAYADQHNRAAMAGFKTWHPGCKSATVESVKAYAKSIGGTPTTLQTRYLATMANAGHLDGGSIKRAWNDAHGTTAAEVNTMLGIGKKATASSASGGGGGGSSKSRRA